MKPLPVSPRITLFTSAIWQTVSTVISDDDAIWLIDPAFFPHELGNMASFVNENEALSTNLLFTHSDFVHISGYAYFQHMTTWGHPLFRNDVASNMKKLLDFDSRHYIERQYETPTIAEEISDGQSWGFLRFFHNPGHTADGIITVHTQERALIAGDMLSNLELPILSGTRRSYELTLEKIQQLVEAFDIQLLIPGHGSPALSQEEILQRIYYDRHYLSELRDMVVEGISRGFGMEELELRMPPMTHRGNLIQGHLKTVHHANIAKVFEEENY